MNTLFLIDARDKFAKEFLWGLTLTERIVLSLQDRDFTEIQIISDFSEKELFFRDLHKKTKPPKLLKNFEIDSNYEKVILISGSSVFDFRVFDLFKNSDKNFNLKDKNSPTILDVSDKIKSASNLEELYKETTSTEFLELSKQNTYIAKLRKHLEWKCVKIESSEDLKIADKILKDSVQKGVNDWPAQIIHPPFEFALAKLASTTKITPNQITYVSISIAFGLTPVLYFGEWAIFMVLSFIMGILDGVDGKLARLTHRTSKGGDLLDHVSDIVYLSFWYFAIGMFFINQGIDVWVPTIILQVAYYLDRIVLGLFSKKKGAELHDYRQIDCWFRRIGARRNPCYWLFMVGFLMNDFLFGYQMVVWWTVITFAFHTFRAIQEINKPAPTTFQS